MAEKELTYAQAMTQIETIVRAMNENEIDVDTLGTQVEKAVQLITLCKSKLVKAQTQIDAVLKNGSTNDKNQ